MGFGEDMVAIPGPVSGAGTNDDTVSVASESGEDENTMSLVKNPSDPFFLALMMLTYAFRLL